MKRKLKCISLNYVLPSVRTFGDPKLNVCEKEELPCFLLLDANLCLINHVHCKYYTAIPYRASTGPEQGFPCVVNSHREKPVFITGNPCSHCRDPVFITGNSL